MYSKCNNYNSSIFNTLYKKHLKEENKNEKRSRFYQKTSSNNRNLYGTKILYDLLKEKI